jgi:uridine kinase
MLKSKISSLKPRVGSTLFIAIDGHGGSGKSTLAELLAIEFSAQIIHTDDFASPDKRINWRKNLIKFVFEPIAQGEKFLNYDRTKWWESHYPTPAVSEPVTEVMILEGVSSLNSEFQKYISLGIYVETPTEVCIKRGVARDSNVGKSENELLKIWKKWIAEENDYFKSNKAKEIADIVVDGTKPFPDQFKMQL